MFGLLVHLDNVYVNFLGQGHTSKLKVAEEKYYFFPVMDANYKVTYTF